VLPDERVPTLLASLQTSIEQHHKLVLAVLPNSRADRYDAFKKFCTSRAQDRGIPSQAILSTTLKKGMSVATKVAIQIICKLGGQPWALNIPVSNTRYKY